MPNNKTATLLLNLIPEEQRATAVRRAVQDLDPESNDSEFGLVADLLHRFQDEEAYTRFIGHLLSSICNGNTAQVTSLCRSCPGIETSILNYTVLHIRQILEQLQQGSAGWLVVPVTRSGAVAPIGEDAVEEADNHTVLVARTTAYLQFMTQVSLLEISPDSVTAVLTACCVLVGATDQGLSVSAHDCIVKLLESNAEICSTQHPLLWNCIYALITSKTAYYQRQGYTLWLRWATSNTVIDQSVMQKPVYWDLLKQGLRLGDSERRKSTLHILRISINLAVEDDHTIGLIADRPSHVDVTWLLEYCIEVNADRLPALVTIQQHYDRFCTVFETIVLSRYLNQVQECEADLDFLASSSSTVKSSWFFTLLASALDPGLQDSNRKFIGAWVMRSALGWDDRSAYVDFLQHSFFPWATQGHLFTSSIRMIQGSTRCLHGDRLADYVNRLVKLSDEKSDSSYVVSQVLDVIIGRQNSKFAYAWVYLLEGLGQAIHSLSSPSFTADQLKKLNDLFALTGCPEVARDHIHLRTWKLVHDLSSRSSNASEVATSNGHDQWTSIQAKLHRLDASANAQREGSIASWTSEPSKRDLYEQKVIESCSKLISEIPTTSGHLDIVDERLNDIWNDLEYLEYPKDLLMVVSKTILNSSLVLEAGKNEHDPLVKTISRMLKDLLEFSKIRTYLLTPLISSIRDLFHQYPDDALPFDLESLVVQLVLQQPAPTIDIKLEDCVSTLLKHIDVSCQVLGYEYYYGPREGYGVANLLDLMNRLWSTKPNQAESILNLLLQRWVKQKTPPPSVSTWKNTLQLQAMVICAEHVMSTTNSGKATQLLKDLQYVLSVEPLPRYRYLLEWVIARLYICHPELQPMILEELRTKDHHSNPKFLAALMKIAVRVAKHEKSSEDFASKLTDVFVPLAASSKIVIRHEAQWQIPALLDHARKQSWITVTENAALKELDDFIRSLARFDDPPSERKIDIFDPILDHTMTNLVEGPWWKLDDIEQPLCGREDFLRLFASDSSSSSSSSTTTTTSKVSPLLPQPCLPLGPPFPSSPSSSSPPPLPLPSDPSRRILQNLDNISRAVGTGPVPSPVALQTKGAAYLESHPSRHSHLLVVASLVDNPYNLGGLSRVAEIFGAAAMYVQNKQVTSSKDFTNVSVSSHLHLPILALATAGMGEWLAKKRKEEGFAVVGIEQTDRSVLVGSEKCVLPEKCIVVMGSEREGIPALVLSECDVLVEIPQVGVTRSLNVQTATGIVLCEYAKQHRR